VIVVKVKGLSADAVMNPLSDSYGYLVLVRQGTNVETHMFGVHTEIVLEPFIDALREMNGYSSSSADPVPVYLRALLSSDGGLTQLKSITSDASLNRLS
jgi:hypothetical protein